MQIFAFNIAMCSEIAFLICTKLFEFKINCPLRTNGRSRTPPQPNPRYATAAFGLGCPHSDSNSPSILSHVVLPSGSGSFTQSVSTWIRLKGSFLQVFHPPSVGQVAQAARRWVTGWTARVRSRVSEGWRCFFTPSCPDWS